MLIKCPGCGAVYELEDSLVGEVAECAACPAMFRIVAPPAGSAPDYVGTGEQVNAPAPAAPASAGTTSPAAKPAEEEFTNTVKLKRPKSEGMIPRYNTQWRHEEKQEVLLESAEVKCPFCEQAYDLTKDMIGQQVQCAACNKEFVIQKDAFLDTPKKGKKPEPPTPEPQNEPEESFFAKLLKKLMFWKKN